MKAFEKWLNQKPDDWDGQRKDVAKVAWKAALKWVLTKTDMNELPANDFGLDIIQKELEEE